MSDLKEIEYYVLEEFDNQQRLERRIWHTASTRETHREGGPAVEEFDPETGKLIGEIWFNRYNHGQHRDGNKPAEISIDPDTGIVTHELYYRFGRLHRDDGGPAQIFRDETSGVVSSCVYYIEGYRHRDGDKPAFQDFDPDTGQLVREEYYQNDVLHRDIGPAIVEYDSAGNVKLGSLQYFRNGHQNKSPPPLTP